MKKQPVVSVCLIILINLLSCTVSANEHDYSTTEAPNLSGIENRLRSLASRGTAEAHFELGLIHEYGRGVTKDDSVAISWYEKAADQLFPDALYRLAILHDNGWGVSSDKEKALRLYKSAAEKGHVLAQHDVAVMYLHGIGTAKSLMQAYKWMKIAVMSGNPLMPKHLSKVTKEMSLDEIAVAEYLAQEWMERF